MMFSSKNNFSCKQIKNLNYSNLFVTIIYLLGSEESSPDELKEFLPESGSDEAAAALSVPLLSADPPAVVAALEQREAKGKQS